MREYLKWFPGTHGSGQFGILSNAGFEVARLDSKADRDLILELIRSHEEMRLTLEAAKAHIRDEIGQFGPRMDYADTDTINKINAALTRANAIGVPECLEED